jgi:hypothetical protein
VLQFVALLVSNFRHAIINHDRDAGQYNLDRKRLHSSDAATPDQVVTIEPGQSVEIKADEQPAYTVV